jgi:gamma-glutamyl hercynylcysteine S-oxide synthase
MTQSPDQNRDDLTSEIVSWHEDARRRTLSLVSDLDDEQLMGPRLAIVNPLRWELGHVAWFQEFWTLRHARGESPILAAGDTLYDSARVAHDTRWDLPLLSMAQTREYAEEVMERSLSRLRRDAATSEEIYFHRLAIFHEDMHGEAFTYTRQTLGYPSPGRDEATRRSPYSGVVEGEAAIDGGEFRLGAEVDSGFVFDNEKWAHPVRVAPFRIARAAVTNREMLSFIEAGGYRTPSLWTSEGWRWREAAAVEAPGYWRRAEGGEWQRRVFDRWIPVDPELPVVHVSWYEADAYCRFVGRRLPTEAEWEMAAARDRRSAGSKRRYPWGDVPPNSQLANTDARAGGPLPVAAFAQGDSDAGCRQMIGNVWEWTASDFEPYPGFVCDPYKEYSAPWFGTHKVLRGGSWATPGRLLRNTWRNFYTPERRDVFAGFRTAGEASL